MITNGIEIRALHTIEELNEVRKLEGKIWGENDSIPVHQTITAVKNGGIVLGAYYENQLVGFQYSFPGFNGKTVYLCSHVLGTDPHFRNFGIGEKLKFAQYQEASKLGYSLITWTYDPLESVNGYLNIGKLGGICSSYIPNCYGEMDDILNSGLPSDRFLVEWHINRNNSIDSRGLNFEVQQAVKNPLFQWEMDKDGNPSPLSVHSLPVQENIFVPIPKNYRNIRESNITTAMMWRLKTREVFTNLFKDGWIVTGFKKTDQPDVPVHFYILTKKESFQNEGDFPHEN